MVLLVHLSRFLYYAHYCGIQVASYKAEKCVLCTNLDENFIITIKNLEKKVGPDQEDCTQQLDWVWGKISVQNSKLTFILGTN